MIHFALLLPVTAGERIDDKVRKEAVDCYKTDTFSLYRSYISGYRACEDSAVGAFVLIDDAASMQTLVDKDPEFAMFGHHILYIIVSFDKSDFIV